jgi:V/A-type H+-transporting ATPase subunit E
MALENLLAGLKAEAAAETARLEEETQAEADRIVQEAREQAGRLQEQAVRSQEREVREEAERRRAHARLESAAALREVREQAFQELLGEVRQRLGTLRERPDYPALLRALVREGLTALPVASTLRVDPRDEGLADELLRELDTRLDVSTTLETAGGAELVSGDGRTVRNTAEERVSNAEPGLRLLFAEMLTDARTAEVP